MYEKKMAILQPPDRSLQSMWRYMTADRLSDLLTTAELFFCHVPSLSDGMEGALTRRSSEHLFHWFIDQGDSPRKAREELLMYEKQAHFFYANCWHMNDGESYLMWRAYADRGFAVRTTFERLSASFDGFPGLVCGGVVEYVDFERSMTDVGNVFTHVITKDLPYMDEREFRLLLWTQHEQNRHIISTGNGVRVPVNLKMLIDQVFINPSVKQVPGELRALIEALNLETSPSLIRFRSSVR